MKNRFHSNNFKPEELGFGQEVVVDISLVAPDPQQIRIHFDEAELRATSESIKQFGQVEAVKVTRAPKGPLAKGKLFEVLDGERRYRAILMAGLKKILIVLRPDVERGAKRRKLQGIFNFNRASHTVMEKSNWMAEQIRDGNTQQQVADMIGVSVATVTAHIRFQYLLPELQKLLGPPTPEDERLSFAVGLSLAKAPKSDQMENFEIIKPLLKTDLRRAKALAAKLARDTNLAAGNKIRGKKPHEDTRKIVGLMERCVKDIAFVMELNNTGKDLETLFRSRPIGEVEGVIRTSKALLGAIGIILESMENLRAVRMEGLSVSATRK